MSPKIIFDAKRDKRSCLVGGKRGNIIWSGNGAGGWPPRGGRAGRGPMSG